MWHRRLGKGCGAVLLGADLACKPASEAQEGGGEQCSPGKAATGCGFQVTLGNLLSMAVCSLGALLSSLSATEKKHNLELRNTAE